MMRYSWIVLSLMAGHVFGGAGVEAVEPCGCCCWGRSSARVAVAQPSPQRSVATVIRSEGSMGSLCAPEGPIGAAGTGIMASNVAAQPVADTATGESATAETQPVPAPAGEVHRLAWSATAPVLALPRMDAGAPCAGAGAASRSYVWEADLEGLVQPVFEFGSFESEGGEAGVEAATHIGSRGHTSPDLRNPRIMLGDFPFVQIRYYYIPFLTFFGFLKQAGIINKDNIAKWVNDQIEAADWLPENARNSLKKLITKGFLHAAPNTIDPWANKQIDKIEHLDDAEKNAIKEFLMQTLGDSSGVSTISTSPDARDIYYDPCLNLVQMLLKFKAIPAGQQESFIRQHIKAIPGIGDIESMLVDSITHAITA